MSSQLKVTDLHNASAERLSLELGQRLQVAAGHSIRQKLASGEIKIVDGRYVGETLNVQRPSALSSRAKKPRIKAC